MSDKISQIIRWDGESFLWVATTNVGHKDHCDLFNYLTHIAPTSFTIVSMPIGVGKDNKVINLEMRIPGLEESKNHPNKAYLVSDIHPPQSTCGHSAPDVVDEDEDIWSDERHDQEIAADESARKIAEIEKISHRLILFGGNLYLANLYPQSQKHKEYLFLLAESHANEQELSRRRLMRNVEQQRKLLGMATLQIERSRKPIPDEIVAFVIDRDVVCQECGVEEDLQIDHIIPHSRGGGDSVENLRLLCSRCNARRGNLKNL